MTGCSSVKIKQEVISDASISKSEQTLSKLKQNHTLFVGKGVARGRGRVATFFFEWQKHRNINTIIISSPFKINTASFNIDIDDRAITIQKNSWPDSLISVRSIQESRVLNKVFWEALIWLNDDLKYGLNIVTDQECQKRVKRLLWRGSINSCGNDNKIIIQISSRDIRLNLVVYMQSGADR